MASWLCHTSPHVEMAPRSFKRVLCSGHVLLAHAHVTNQHSPLCCWPGIPGGHQALRVGPALSPGLRLRAPPLSRAALSSGHGPISVLPSFLVPQAGGGPQQRGLHAMLGNHLPWLPFCGDICPNHLPYDHRLPALRGSRSPRLRLARVCPKKARRTNLLGKWTAGLVRALTLPPHSGTQ